MRELMFVLIATMSCMVLAAPVAAPSPAVAAVAVEVPAMPEAAPVVPQEPPMWLVKALDVLSALPVVGPALSEVAKWLGVVASIATILVTALLGVLKALNLVLNLAKLTDLAAKVALWGDHPIMYWLKFVSVYNAKKKEVKTS